MKTPIIAVFSIVFLAACGGPPADNPLLVEARLSYDAAVQDPDVLAHGAVALKAAERDLERGERLWREEAKEEQVTHYAYLARQRVRIAEKRTELGMAEKEVEQAELERKEVLLAAREAEAAKARAEAQRAESQARVAEQQAERATEQAQRATVQAQEKAREAELAKQAAAEAAAAAMALAERVAELEAQRTERGLVLTLSDVLFDVDKATLKPGAERAVGELVAFLDEYPERNVLIEGFTDSTGDEAYNLELSERRADAVRGALTARGIAPDRIAIRGFGEQFPVATNDTAAGRQQNRRVEVIISDETGVVKQRQGTVGN